MHDATVTDLKKRADAAWRKRQLYDRMLRDVYDYVLPMRNVTGLHVPMGESEAAKRVDKVFDATAVKAAFRWAGRLQQDVTPMFHDFFSIEAGPLLQDGDEKKALTEEFQAVGRIVHGIMQSGTYHTASHEMYTDLYAGTGHMQILNGDDREPVRTRVVPVPEVAIEEGPWGRVEHWYWKRRWRADELPILWPKARFSEQMRGLITNQRDTEIEVCQYTYYDARSRDYKLLVWADKDGDADKPFWTEAFRTSPWVTARLFKVPGEAYGRGPAQLAMPFIKTTNMARELALKAAAFALMGIWVYRGDGAFNPDTVRFEPKAMWRVRATGGPLGPTIQRLPIPQDFDISSVIIADEREQMKAALFDDTLPPDTGAVRSATEIAERIARRNEDLGGAYGRLTLEIVVPTVQRYIDLLEQQGYLDTSLTIDQLLTQVRVIAPIAAAQQASKVQSAVNWLQMLQMLGGPEAMTMAAKVEELGPQIGRWLGVEERFIRSGAERQEMMANAQQKAEEAHQAELAKAMPQPPPQQQQFLDGGGL